jgi:hypothetical protein
VVHLDDESGTGPGKPAISQERRNDLNQALSFMLAKMRCRGHALSCFLDELPSELIPRQPHRGTAASSSDGELVVNSRFRFAPRGEAPPDIGERVPPMDGLLREVPLAWIEDSGTGVWVPFWARGEWVEALESLRPGQPAPATLSARIRQTLASVDLLVPAGAERKRREAWGTIYRDAGAQFQTQGYAIVRDLIHPVHIGALRRYYGALVAGGRLPMGDDQVAERSRLHSEPVAMFFHPQLVSLVSRIAGEPVKPSYLYFASYPSGSGLPRHVDRLQCEFSISLLIDYSPEPDGPCGWSLLVVLVWIECVVSC